MRRKIENKIKGQGGGEKKCKINYTERYIKTIYKNMQIKIKMK